MATSDGLEQGRLLETDGRRRIVEKGPDLHLDHIADGEEIRGSRSPGPGVGRGRQLQIVGADAESCRTATSSGRRGDHRGDDIADRHRLRPAGGLEGLNRHALRNDIAPRFPVTAAALVDSPKAPVDREVGGVLQVEVKCRLHHEPCVVERVGAVVLLERLADLFGEVGSSRSLGRWLASHHEGPPGGLGRLLSRDESFSGHARQYVVVAARLRLIGVHEWAEAGRSLNDGRNRGGLLQGQILRGFVEVESRARLQPYAP